MKYSILRILPPLMDKPVFRPTAVLHEAVAIEIPRAINPLQRKKIPKTQDEILARINEITFNSSLMSELRGITFVGKLIDEGKLPRGTGTGQYRRINVHRVALTGPAQTLDAASRLHTDYDFFEMLRTNGRRAARRFLDAHYDDIGVRSTVDFEAAPEAASA